MLIFMAFVFFTCAYYAEPIANNWPTVQQGFKGLRGFADDFGAGDPNKIIHYKMVNATLMDHGYESANIRYSIHGYLMTTGITARNEDERVILQTTPINGGLVVFYDEVNPTIVVMQPTYNLAVRKMKNIYVSKPGTKDPKDKPQPKFLPGAGNENIVLFVRLACLMIGAVLMYLGARPERPDPFDGFIRPTDYR